LFNATGGKGKFLDEKVGSYSGVLYHKCPEADSLMLKNQLP
jgi:hypothetical protein